MNTKTKAMLASYGRSFLTAALATFVATGGDIFSLDVAGLKAIITAGVVAVLPVLMRALNPNDKAFGKEAE
jgi:hypothetical protein